MEFEIVLKVTNIGDSTFNGGTVERILLELERVGHTAVMDSIQLPTLETNQTCELPPVRLTPVNDGLGWLVVAIQASDRQEVEYYKDRRFSTGKEWRDAVYVKKREDDQMIDLLEKIVKLLESRK